MTTDTKPDLLERLRARLAAATPRPWTRSAEDGRIGAPPIPVWHCIIRHLDDVDPVLDPAP